MKRLPLASLLGLATLGAHAQANTTPITFDPVVVTATRTQDPASTLRDATVITRAELEASGSLGLAEVLQRRAGIEYRATGGPGQPVGLFVRGAGSAQTLVLIDGMRAGSATVGTTSIENIPLDMIERIEVIKGPLSSLYGSDAIGGVIQIFTRGRSVPHFFASGAVGTDRDLRAAAGVSTVEGDSAFALSMGGRKVDAPSATTPRAAFCYDPDRDPYDNGFVNLHASQRLSPTEVVQLDAFGSKGRTHFDGCSTTTDDRNDQTLTGWRLSSSSKFTRDWSSTLWIGEGRDKLDIHGDFPDRFETRQEQVAWTNEYAVPGGKFLVGFEGLRQKVVNNPNGTSFSNTERDTRSFFAGLTQAWDVERLELSARRDDDDAYGARNTGSAAFGIKWPGVAHFSFTYGQGFRAGTFYDLYGPSSTFYQPNPNLKPEQNRSNELSVRNDGGPFGWRVTAFDNRIEDLIVYVFPTVENVNRARIRGVELTGEGTAWGVHWQASGTFQRPRDEDTGARLQGRAERFGAFNASYAIGAFTVGATITASGERFDSTNEAPESRMAGYGTLDARVAWRLDKSTQLELAAVNLTDKRFETAVGYEGTRRGVLLSVRFDAF
jgi:vitamin B12 transporter